MKHKRELQILGIILTFATVGALECYRCQDPSGSCEKDEVPTLYNCTRDGDVCAKLHGKNTAGKQSIARICLPRQDFKPVDCTEFIKGVEHCIYKCDTDGCNSAPNSITSRSLWDALFRNLLAVLTLCVISGITYP